MSSSRAVQLPRLALPVPLQGWKAQSKSIQTGRVSNLSDDDRRILSTFIRYKPGEKDQQFFPDEISKKVKGSCLSCKCGKKKLDAISKTSVQRAYKRIADYLRLEFNAKSEKENNLLKHSSRAESIWNNIFGDISEEIIPFFESNEEARTILLPLIEVTKQIIEESQKIRENERHYSPVTCSPQVVIPDGSVGIPAVTVPEPLPSLSKREDSESLIDHPCLSSDRYGNSYLREEMIPFRRVLSLSPPISCRFREDLNSFQTNPRRRNSKSLDTARKVQERIKELSTSRVDSTSQSVSTSRRVEERMPYVPLGGVETPRVNQEKRLGKAASQSFSPVPQVRLTFLPLSQIASSAIPEESLGHVRTSEKEERDLVESLKKSARIAAKTPELPPSFYRYMQPNTNIPTIPIVDLQGERCSPAIQSKESLKELGSGGLKHTNSEGSLLTSALRAEKAKSSFQDACRVVSLGQEFAISPKNQDSNTSQIESTSHAEMSSFSTSSKKKSDEPASTNAFYHLQSLQRPEKGMSTSSFLTPRRVSSRFYPLPAIPGPLNQQVSVRTQGNFSNAVVDPFTSSFGAMSSSKSGSSSSSSSQTTFFSIAQIYASSASGSGSLGMGASSGSDCREVFQKRTPFQLALPNQINEKDPPSKGRRARTLPHAPYSFCPGINDLSSEAPARSENRGFSFSVRQPPSLQFVPQASSTSSTVSRTLTATKKAEGFNHLSVEKPGCPTYAVVASSRALNSIASAKGSGQIQMTTPQVPLSVLENARHDSTSSSFLRTPPPSSVRLEKKSSNPIASKLKNSRLIGHRLKEGLPVAIPSNPLLKTEDENDYEIYSAPEENQQAKKS